MKVYEHPKCSTCKKARAYLEKKGVLAEFVDITKNPPSFEELKAAFAARGAVKKLFNTSGMLYRELGLKERLPLMTDEEALALLSKQGMLVKRPFLISEDHVLTGFAEKEWEQTL